MIFVCLVGILFILKLYHLQIINGAEYLEKSEKRLVREVEVEAPRGEIYDRYGKILVSNTIGYDVALYYTKIGETELNQILLKVAQILEKNNDKWINHFPIDFEKMEFASSDITMQSWKEEHKIKEDATVEDVITFYKEKYGISGDNINDLAKIIPLRFEISEKGYTAIEVFL